MSRHFFAMHRDWVRVRRGLTVLSLAILAQGELSALAESDADGYTAGIMSHGSAGVREKSLDIMDRQQETAARAMTPKNYPFFRPDFQNLPSSPDSPNAVN